MSNEIDSNMLLTSLLYCYGGFIQNEENRIVIGQGSNRRGAIEALQVMRDIYRNGMSDEVFAWNAASNNNAFVAGRLSVALNAISIVRTAEDSGNQALADDTWLASIPRGPVMRMGNEHVMGVFVIWKFAKNKEAAKKYLVDQQLGYREHFLRSEYYNFPPWTGAIKGGFKTIRQLSAQDTHKPRGKYTILTTIAEKYTTNPGHPGNTTAGDGRGLQHLPHPADVRRGRAGQVDPGRGGVGLRAQGEGHLPEVEEPGARVAASTAACCEGPGEGASLFTSGYGVKTTRAATRPASTSSIASFTSSSGRTSRMTVVFPAAWRSKTSRRSVRVPTIEPTTVIPFSTVSKIGGCIRFSAGRATKTSVPPRRSEP